MRADAQRNRTRLLDAAVELILDVGDEPPLDAVARRAGVGIGTLYRHFPDRDALLRAVAEHALAESIVAATDALAAAGDGFAALHQYVHTAVRRGVGVLNLIHPLIDDPDWSAPRATITTLLDELVQRARADGSVRPDTRMPDIVFAVIRFSRPVSLGLDPADERALAHRHLDIYLDGLAVERGGALPEPAVLRRWPN